jgi:hypothetical protein
MTRKSLGKNMLRVCEVIEQLGPCTSGAVSSVVGKNVGIYCDRAGEHGLVEVDHSSRPRRYAIVEGWREIADTGKARKEGQGPRKARTYDSTPLQAIWGPMLLVGSV